jgi:hypothetical protein
MANGYCPALLAHIQDVAEGNAPGKKIHTSGFTKMLFCCQNSTVSPVNDGYAGGQQRTLTIKYRQRPLLTSVTDVDDCSIDRIPGYAEWSLPALLFRKTSFFLSDDEISKYCADSAASASVGGQGPTGFMREHYELWVEHANILMRAINLALVTAMATQFGENVNTGLTTARTINIPPTGMNWNLTAGMIQFLADLRDNEICDEPCIVGGGLLSNWDMARVMECCNQAGVDPSRLGVPPLWYDKDTQTAWGANQFGVFAKGSVKMISRDRYVGNYAGQKGNSVFFNTPFPVNEFVGCDPIQCLNDLSFDVQMRYIDCPTDIDVAGVPTTVNRGWQVILSKTFGLWVQPTTAYAAGDPLQDTNGTLRYVVTNA